MCICYVSQLSYLAKFHPFMCMKRMKELLQLQKCLSVFFEPVAIIMVQQWKTGGDAALKFLHWHTNQWCQAQQHPHLCLLKVPTLSTTHKIPHHPLLYQFKTLHMVTLGGKVHKRKVSKQCHSFHLIAVLNLMLSCHCLYAIGLVR